MLNRKKYLCSMLCALCSISAFADDSDCLGFKVSPHVEIHVPQWRKEVVQPLKPMDLLHGNVVSTLGEEYRISAHAEYLEDGICVVLDGVSATIGYSDFSVQIDSRHIPGSCAYDATLDHEDEHIRAHLSVIDDYESEIRRSVFDAADGVAPVFVETTDDTDAVLDQFNNDIQNNPEIILLKQNIKAQEEIRNKKIDQNDPGTRLEKCRK